MKTSLKFKFIRLITTVILQFKIYKNISNLLYKYRQIKHHTVNSNFNHRLFQTRSKPYPD